MLKGSNLLGAADDEKMTVPTKMRGSNNRKKESMKLSMIRKKECSLGECLKF